MYEEEADEINKMIDEKIKDAKMENLKEAIEFNFDEEKRAYILKLIEHAIETTWLNMRAISIACPKCQYSTDGKPIFITLKSHAWLKNAGE